MYADILGYSGLYIEFLKKMRKFRWIENEPVFRELKGLDHKIKIDQGLKGIRKTVEGD